MLKLSADQWDSLQQRDARQYVAAVSDQFLSNRPEMLEEPGRSVIQERMQAAHDEAISLGFTSPAHIILLMYLAADAPEIEADPLIKSYLSKPGAAPEQRLDDMLSLMSKKLEKAD